MPEKDELISILTHPGSIRFHANENAMLAIEREITNLKKLLISQVSKKEKILKVFFKRILSISWDYLYRNVS